jgi:hypothetical protein
LLALGSLLGGCSSGFGWEGEWRGNHSLPVKNGENPGLIRTLGQVTVKIRGDRFEMAEAGVPYTGSVRFEDKRAFLKIETRFDRPIEKEPIEVQKQMKEIELTGNANGTATFRDPGGFLPEPVVLSKSGRS